MEHPLRFDDLTVDPSSLKRYLVRLANVTLNQLWLNSNLKNRIVIGRHSLHSSGTDIAHMARYQNQDTGRYDGDHLYGSTGCKDYTKSMKNVLKSALQSFDLTQVKDRTIPQMNDHRECPQSKYQNTTTFHPSVQHRTGIMFSTPTI